MYEYHTRLDKERKRPVKVTGRIFGKITEEEGFIESDKARLRFRKEEIGKIQVKKRALQV